jgi:hypothetical protein
MSRDDCQLTVYAAAGAKRVATSVKAAKTREERDRRPIVHQKASSICAWRWSGSSTMAAKTEGKPRTRSALARRRVRATL